MATFEEKTWKDRVSTYPTRRVLTDTDGGTQTVTIERAEGTVTTEGDAFNAANMNDLEGRITAAVETLETNFQAGCDTIADALTAAGVDTAEGATPEEIAEGIATLAAGSGTSCGSDEELDDGIEDPTDGLTHLHVLVEPNGTAGLYFYNSGNSSGYITVEWGDGTYEAYYGTGSVKPSHTYSNTEATIYDICITCSSLITSFALGYGSTSGSVMTEGQLIKAFLGYGAALRTYSFAYCYNLIYVDFGEYITSITQNACYCCENLRKVVLSDNITSVGLLAFYCCHSLASLDIPAAEIGYSAFSNCCSLQSCTMATGAYFTYSGTSTSADIANACYRLTELAGLCIPHDDFGVTAKLSACSRLTTLTNLGDIEYSINCSACPLSYDSIINLFNALSSEYTGPVSLSAGCYALLSDDDLAIATDKGWTVTAV